MGTSWSLHAVSPTAEVASGVQAALDLVVAQMSQWEPGSDLSRINRAAPGEWYDIPIEFGHVVGEALEIACASGGAFDPGLGRITDAWGFGGAGPVGHAPDAGDSLARRTIEFDPVSRRIRRDEGAALDLSGIAKGYGVDLAAEWLLGQGVRHFLLEVGGELRGEGIRPDGQPWPTYPMIFRVSSAHEEAGERVYSVSTKEFLGDDDGNVRALRLVEVVFENGRDALAWLIDRIDHGVPARIP